MKKRVLLLGGNYYPEPTGIGKYNTEMMDWLSEHGYECAVVSTYPYYPYWQIQLPYLNKASWYKKETRIVKDDIKLVIYRCPHYVPAIPTGMKRVLSDLSFFLSAFFQMVRLLFRKKFDYVLVTAPPFQIGLLGWIYKKIRGGSLIYHIQDLQIDAAIELGMIKSKFVARSMLGLEKFILRKANFVSSISTGMIKKIKGKYNRLVTLFPNWADTCAFYPIDDKSALKLRFNFKPTDKIVLYSGAIGEKQGLQALLYTAQELSNATYIKFIICGSGPYKEKLVALSKKMILTNVFFMPLQPLEMFNDFLNMADVHLILQKANDNELFLPSKLTTICAVGGLAVVTASLKTSLHRLVTEHQLGILIEPGNQAALTAAVKMSIYQNHSSFKINARKYATEYLNIDQVMSQFFTTIDPDAILPSIPEKHSTGQVLKKGGSPQPPLQQETTLQESLKKN